MQAAVVAVAKQFEVFAKVFAVVQAVAACPAGYDDRDGGLLPHFEVRVVGVYAFADLVYAAGDFVAGNNAGANARGFCTGVEPVVGTAKGVRFNLEDNFAWAGYGNVFFG